MITASEIMPQLSAFWSRTLGPMVQRLGFRVRDFGAKQKMQYYRTMIGVQSVRAGTLNRYPSE
jgi:hypothetical protein